MTRGLALVFLLIVSVPAGAVRVDERDPDYQRSLADIALAHQALATARRALARSRTLQPLPGLAYDRLDADLGTLLDALGRVTTPERQRLRYQTLVPNGPYFVSPQEGETP